MIINEKYTTKHKFADALDKLMLEKPFAKIGISDITKESGLSRQTFYRHFVDIYDLVNWLHSNRNQLSIAIFAQNEDIEESFYYSLKMMQQYKIFYLYIATTDGPNSFPAYYCKTIQDACINHIGQKNLNDELYTAIRLYSVGSSHLILEWIKNKMTESPKTLAHYLACSLPKNLTKFYDLN